MKGERQVVRREKRESGRKRKRKINRIYIYVIGWVGSEEREKRWREKWNSSE